MFNTCIPILQQLLIFTTGRICGRTLRHESNFPPIKLFTAPRLYNFYQRPSEYADLSSKFLLIWTMTKTLFIDKRGFRIHRALLWWSTKTEISTAECAVRIQFQRLAKTTQDATVSTLRLFQLIYRCSTKVKSVFSVPPDASTNYNSCIFARWGDDSTFKLVLEAVASTDPSIIFNRTCCLLLNYVIASSDFCRNSVCLSSNVRYSSARTSLSADRIPNCLLV